MRYKRLETLLGNIKSFKKIKICIIGAGSVGSFLAEFLLRSGFENIKIIDRDFVEIENLSNQNYSEEDLGKPKSFALSQRLKKINNNAKIKYVIDDLDYKNINKYLEGADIVFDAVDNIHTRFLINDYCVKNKKPWFYTSIIRDMGYLFNIIPNGACLRCITRENSLTETCETNGVLSVLPTFVASLQTSSVINYFLGKKEQNFLIVNLTDKKIEKLKVKKNKNCICCVKGIFEYLNGKQSEMSKLCGSNSFQIKIESDIDFESLKKLKKIGKVSKNKHIFHFSKGKISVSIFKNGRIIIKGFEKEDDARKFLSKYFGIS